MTKLEAIQKTRELIEKQGTVAKRTFHDGVNFCARGALLYVAGKRGEIERGLTKKLVGFTNADTELTNEILVLAAEHHIFLQHDNDYKGYSAVIADLKKIERLAA